MVHVTQNHVQLTESFPRDVQYSCPIKIYAVYLICLSFSLLFSLMTPHFDNTKFTTLIWKESEYCFISQPFCFVFVFCFNFVILLNKLKRGFPSDFVFSNFRNQGNVVILLASPNLTQEGVISCLFQWDMQGRSASSTCTFSSSVVRIRSHVANQSRADNF